MANAMFQNLFIKYQNDFINYARHLTRSEHRAKDLVQNAAIKAYLHLDKLDDFSKFRPWVTRIIYNTHISNYRKKKRRHELFTQRGSNRGAFFDQVACFNGGVENLRVADIKELGRYLNRDAYRAFEMFAQGYSYKEIADTLNVAIGTVKSRIYNARKKLMGLTRKLDLVA